MLWKLEGEAEMPGVSPSRHNRNLLLRESVAV